MSEEARKLMLRAELEAELNPRRSCLHRTFLAIRSVAVVTAFLMAASQFVGIYFQSLDALKSVLRGYMIAFSLIVAFNEVEFTSIVRNSAVLRNWISRGLLYTFIGVLGLVEYEADMTSSLAALSGKNRALRFIRVSAWIMVALGILYFGMGVLCLQLIFNRLQEDYKKRLEQAKVTRRATERYGSLSSGDSNV
jgi:hypothetical protein